MQDVFIIGAKGIGNYGGYETFIKKLLENEKDNDEIRFHISCKYNGQGAMDESKLNKVTLINDHHFIYKNADCFKIDIPEKLGSAQAIYYDIASIKECIRQIKQNAIEHPIVYVLACRIGPFISKYVRQIHKLGGKLFVNPDGHEWMRAKWSKPIRKYWKISEARMIKYADLVVCDSKNIEEYIKSTYQNYNPQTTFIAYGADSSHSTLNKYSTSVREWYGKYSIKENKYFLVVGRFVPENNYETIISEFIKSSVNKDLVLVTNVEHNNFYKYLRNKTGFNTDSRIKFVGTVYNSELLKYIREHAFGYIHGHSVGGTNPSLLQSLSSTRLNLLFDIGFNREVACDTALYWDKTQGSLSGLLEQTVQMKQSEIEELGERSKERIKEEYNWQLITKKYNNIFLSR